MKQTFGIEREWFITKDGLISPAIGELLPALKNECKISGIEENRFGFELFAGQIEDRTPVCKSKSDLMSALKENEYFLKKVGNSLGLDFACVEFVSEEALGNLVVNPFDERHKKIWNEISTPEKVAASQVAAIHIHFGVTIQEAVSVLNYCRKEVIDYLCQIGNSLNGERLKAYRKMAKVYGDSRIFSCPDDLLKFIEKSGGEKNVWDMVRYKTSTQTIEFRMFGATDNYEDINKFVMVSEEVLYKSLN